MIKHPVLAGVALVAAVAAAVLLTAATPTRDPVADAVAVRPVTGSAAFPVSGQASTLVQTEVCVVSSGAGTMIPSTPMAGRRALEACNYGPNAIWCAPTSGAVVNKSRRINTGGDCWKLDLTDAQTINCKAATADQSTGACTVVTEAK